MQLLQKIEPVNVETKLVKKPTVAARLQALKCCVVIPTFNNQNTLKRVLDGVLRYTTDIFIINDGSNDATVQILKRYPQITQFHLPKNKGKGYALKFGFKKALQHGFHYAITLDSDGQHYPQDLPIFLETLEQATNKNVLIIGDRNMDVADVPAQSSRGNRASTYWVKAVTDNYYADTQSGFRLYPIKAFETIRFFKSTRKFEFETEVIVKAVWNNIEVKNVPIQVLYDERERVSHFRPFWDIARITTLVIWFLLVKYCYNRPRDFFKKLKKKGVKRFFSEDLIKQHDSPLKKAYSMALGVFIGLSPLWGFHTVVVIFLAIFFNLNKVIAFAFSNISLPPFIPFVFLMSLTIGNWVLGIENTLSFVEIQQNFEMLKSLRSYLIGSITLSLGAAILAGSLGYIFFSLTEKRKAVTHG